MSRGLAVITGASTGIGAEFSRQLASQGYDLLLIARRLEPLQKVADQINAVRSIHCETMSADLTSDEDLLRVESRLRESENLNLLVNNAGFGTLGFFYKNTLESQDKMHRLHVIATMRLTHAALSGMVARNRGSIINVSSVAAFALSAGSTSYCATKAWMNRFTEGLFLELRMSGSHVKVQALCPGYTRTEFHQTLEMDTSQIPGWMWLSAERVVRDSLDGLAAGKLFVIPGRRYQSALRLYSALPQRLRHAFAIGGSKYRKTKL